MNVRSAAESDSDQITEIAERSFQASYALSPQQIEGILASEFDTDDVEARIEEGEDILLVAESEDEDVVAFVDARVTDDDAGEIVWLHVAPAARGLGAGTELFQAAVAQLRERSTAEVRAHVLAQNSEGSDFFERFEFERAGQNDRDFGSLTLNEEVYVDEPTPDEETEPVRPEENELTVEGERRYVDSDESIPGDENPFFIVFETEAREDRFGFYCSNCGTFTDSVDGQGKVVCEECGNFHKPDEWDASYL
jgi:ribosomal protein S18 acetylase RimI-like enzyme